MTVIVIVIVTVTVTVIVTVIVTVTVTVTVIVTVTNPTNSSSTDYYLPPYRGATPLLVKFAVTKELAKPIKTGAVLRLQVCSCSCS